MHYSHSRSTLIKLSLSPLPSQHTHFWSDFSFLLDIHFTLFLNIISSQYARDLEFFSFFYTSKLLLLFIGSKVSALIFVLFVVLFGSTLLRNYFWFVFLFFLKFIYGVYFTPLFILYLLCVDCLHFYSSVSIKKPVLELSFRFYFVLLCILKIPCNTNDHRAIGEKF